MSEDITKTDQIDHTNDRDGYNRVCYLCHRTEDKVEKMITIPNNICICSDCMQKTFDQIGIQGMPNLNGLSNIPGVEFINFAGPFAGMPEEMQAKHSVKPKKKKKAIANEPVLDIHRLPAPHVIKGNLDEYVMGQEQAKR